MEKVVTLLSGNSKKTNTEYTERKSSCETEELVLSGVVKRVSYSCYYYCCSYLLFFGSSTGWSKINATLHSS